MFISSTKCGLLLVLQLSFQKIFPNLDDPPPPVLGQQGPTFQHCCWFLVVVSWHFSNSSMILS